MARYRRVRRGGPSALDADAARTVHRRQADRLLSAGEVGDEAVGEEYEAVVFRREID